MTGEVDVAPCQRNFTNQSHLRDVPFPKANGPVQIIIGAAHYNATMLVEALDRMFYHDFAIVFEEEMVQSEENRRAVKRVKDTIYFDKKLQKYIMGLPWLYEKEKIVEIIKSMNARAMTIKRTKSL